MLFRDRLRKSPALAQQYEVLKYKLAAQFRDDREAYTAAKEEFVMSIVNLSA
jgi:GrpB-like predicted nucleotidyltransferase (UPF0157 family)